MATDLLFFVCFFSFLQRAVFTAGRCFCPVPRGGIIDICVPISITRYRGPITGIAFSFRVPGIWISVDSTGNDLFHLEFLFFLLLLLAIDFLNDVLKETNTLYSSLLLFRCKTRD